MNLITNRPTGEEIPLILLDQQEFSAFKSRADRSILNQVESREFQPEFGNVAILHKAEGTLHGVLVGLENPPADPRALLRLFAGLAESLPSKYAYALASESSVEPTTAALGWGLAEYQFTRYQKKEPKPRPKLCITAPVSMADIASQLEAIFFARDLINTPANDLGPGEVCAKARELAETWNAELNIVEGDRLLEENYPAIHAVGKGSARPPALIDLKWGDPSNPKLTLVGKGVVFDTGGLSLKTNANMVLMKKDMGGAAITMALAGMVMRRGLKVRLRLLVPTVENTPGPTSYRPGDIIPTRKGLRVEIGNTDAEGRVILCDALAEAASEDPDLLLDMATLTGAARVALGPDLPGFWTPDDALADALKAASDQVGDPVWRMPLWHPYLKMMKSPCADLNNAGNGPFAGAITAALYLYEFVKPLKRWIHFDVYGWNKDSSPGAPKGGEASALRAIYHFLETRYGT